MKISIVILNYNGLSDTLECLESINRLKKGNFEIETIVVDNNSKDGSQQALAKVKDIQLIENSENIGFSGGNNKGIARALKRGSDSVLILNNDTVADGNLLKNLLISSKTFDIISPKIYFAKGYEFHKNRYKKDQLGKIIWYAGGKIDWDNILGLHEGVDEVDAGQFEKKRETDFATGACMLIKSEVFKKIGYLDEKYFLYLEDMDFCVRAKKSGFKIGIEPSAILWHKNAASTGGSGSKLQDYYITRSRLLFAFKYAKFKTKLAVIKEVLKSKNRVRRKALVDFLLLRFGEADIK